MKRFALYILPVVLAAVAARADVVHLKNGGSVRGEVIKQDDKTITLKVSYGTVIVDRDHITGIEKEEASRVIAAEVDAMLKDGHIDAAIDRLENALKSSPDSAILTDRLVSACRRKAETLQQQGKPSEADAFWRRVLALDAHNDAAADAVKRFEEMKRNAPAAEAEAQFLVSIGREREALEMFDALETTTPGAAARNRKAIALARAEYGRRLLELKLFPDSKRQYDIALKLDPDLLAPFKHEIFLARFSVVVADINRNGKAMTREQWLSTLEELKALETYEPENLHVHYAMGICLAEMKRYGEAAVEYAKVTDTKVDADKALERVEALQAMARDKTRESPILLTFHDTRFDAVRPGEPQILETVHFVIHHNNDDLAVLVARAAEYYLERNWHVFADRMPDVPWSKKCDIYLYRSKEEYLQKTRQAEWSPAMTSTSAIEGKLERHYIATYQGVDDLLSSHLSHEITHAIHGAVVNYKSTIPTWLREGTAVRQEPWFKRLRMAHVIREARDGGKLMTMEQVTGQKGYPDASLVNLFYSQSYALVEAIQQSGTREQFAQFCRLAENVEPLAAVRQVYGIDTAELKTRWEKHQTDLVSLLDAP